ncbi:uncharacterized protein LOC125230129 [Leguminivora glycinivorella]|uniref:uncharacterized protein LOC125230129 n=1 Tax=Leguminivora glycinivorella TaxID=1035111 RepID=UPI00200BCF78|nr:uncharacterized protein LOC125230129 [Leguminivora glycinivorella]
MKVMVIFIIVAPSLSWQRRHSDSGSSEVDDSRQTQEYDDDQPDYRSRKKDKSRYEIHTNSAELEASNKKYIKHSSKHSRRRLKKHTNDHCESNECEQVDPNAEQQSGISPGNLVFVPYPYPLVVPPPVPPPMLVPPGLPTTVSSITTSTSPTKDHEALRALNNQKIAEIADKENYWDLLRSLKHRHELPYVKNDSGPMRRYLLDRLLSHVRNVKDINSV